jgi:hypothetical protein
MHVCGRDDQRRQDPNVWANDGDGVVVGMERMRNNHSTATEANNDNYYVVAWCIGLQGSNVGERQEDEKESCSREMKHCLPSWEHYSRASGRKARLPRGRLSHGELSINAVAVRHQQFIVPAQAASAPLSLGSLKCEKGLVWIRS